MSVIFDDGSEGFSPAQASSREATKDEDYYMEVFFVTFEVEDRLFRVPSYQFFKESPEFSEKYKLLAHARADDGHPIELEKVLQADFRSLLKVLYPLSISAYLSLSKKEWISVLTLSSEWKFLRVRKIARVELERLGSLTSLEKVCLGRDIYIPAWVISGFIGFITATTITDDEALKIDSAIMTTAYKLFRIRELRITDRIISTSDVKTEVEEIFREELNRLRSEERAFNDDSEEKTGDEEEEVGIGNFSFAKEPKADTPFEPMGTPPAEKQKKKSIIRKSIW